MNINWRRIVDVGLPTESNKKYLVTDGKDISTSGVSGVTRFKDGEKPKFTFKEWTGDDNVWENNNCCSGERIFDMKPTHWCPVDEINLP